MGGVVGEEIVPSGVMVTFPVTAPLADAEHISTFFVAPVRYILHAGKGAAEVFATPKIASAAGVFVAVPDAGSDVAGTDTLTEVVPFWRFAVT